MHTPIGRINRLTFILAMPKTTTYRRAKDTDKNANEYTRRMTTNINTENMNTTTTTSNV